MFSADFYSYAECVQQYLTFSTEYAVGMQIMMDREHLW